MSRLKGIVVLIIDIVAFYAALALTLRLRYGEDSFRFAAENHLLPFSLLFILWFLVFYISDLYNIRELKIERLFFQKMAKLVALNTLLSVVIFYLAEPWLALTPKTNLLIFAIFFSAIAAFARILAIRLFLGPYVRTKLLILGRAPIINECIAYLKNNPQLGYETTNVQMIKNASDLDSAMIHGSAYTMIVAPKLLRDNSKTAKTVYRLLSSNIEIITATDFYERVFEKIPLEEVSESWFIRAVATRHRFYDALKRFFDLSAAVILGLVFSPVMLIIATSIRLTSPGPILYKHERIGQNNKPFTLYKFRSMHAGNAGPLWTLDSDSRVTPVGRIIRRTHLDELPQIWNILRGELSFIGPRAESADLASLYGQLPHYEIRHIIKPGLTGWAQLNYRASASIEEAFEKLKYDIYYLKNRNIMLDLLIFVKTARFIFTSQQ